MLDKNDLKALGELIDQKVTKTLGDFFEGVIEPYFDRLDKRHDSHDNNFDTVFRKLDEIDDHIIGHEKRIKKLETTLNP